MDQETIDSIARTIFTAQQNREQFQPLRADNDPGNLENAYDVQDALYRLMQNEGKSGAFGGHKIALTSPDIQKMCGVDQPAYGRIFAAKIHHSPHSARLSEFVRIGVEFEVAFEIGEDVPLGKGLINQDNIKPYVKSAMPALELIDDRNADYSDLDAKSILTDKCWCGGIVLGKPVEDWQNIDLGNLKSHVTWNGTINDHGNTGNALGHPLKGLAWIANHLAKRGGALKSGDIIMTGSALKTQFPKAGDNCTYMIEGLGDVSVTVV